MNRLEALTGWFFTLLGILLFGWSVLIVPERAFAFMTEPTCSELCCEAICGDPYCDPSCSPEFGDCHTTCESCKSECQYAANPATCEEECNFQASVISCLKVGCEDELYICTDACKNKACKDGGLDPKYAVCATRAGGCRCWVY